MNFIGDSQPLSQQGIDATTQLLGVGPAEVWTLLAVETQGCGYLPDRRPAILFERHIFHNQTRGVYDASDPSISSPTPGGYLGGTLEYNRLQQAMALDFHAALKSASWGIGQVMGFNSGIAGFASVEDMVTAMVDGEDSQLSAVANFLIANKLNQQMASHNWSGFALGYNGPNYKENHYEARLAAAYASYSSGALPNLMVRQAQVLLTFLGISPGRVDGIQGKLTSSAIVRFEEERGLETTTIVDTTLVAALQTALLEMPIDNGS
jgi:hypothetical protein